MFVAAASPPAAASPTGCVDLVQTRLRGHGRSRAWLVTACLWTSGFGRAAADSIQCASSARESVRCSWLSNVRPLQPEDAHCTLLTAKEAKALFGLQPEELAEVLRGLPELRELQLSGLKLGDSGVHAVAQSLERMPFLEKLYLAHNNVGIAGAGFLARALKHVPQLRILNLPENIMRGEGIEVLARAFVSGALPNLRQLVLAGNGIGTVGARALAIALQHMPNLKDLHLGRNALGGQGISALAQAFQGGHAASLEWLSLGENHLGDAGLHVLSTSLKGMPNLEMLDLEMNSIKNGGATVLGEAIGRSKIRLRLRDVDLRGNLVGEVGRKRLEAETAHLADLQFFTGEVPGRRNVVFPGKSTTPPVVEGFNYASDSLHDAKVPSQQLHSNAEVPVGALGVSDDTFSQTADF